MFDQIAYEKVINLETIEFLFEESFIRVVV